jgi:hypothetical protein
MAEPTFYVVYLNPKEGMTTPAVEKKMNQALDWFRLENCLWVVYSTSSVDKLYTRLSSLAKDSGRLFICKLDVTERQGWMNKDFWKWLRREDDPLSK